MRIKRGFGKLGLIIIVIIALVVGFFVTKMFTGTSDGFDEVKTNVKLPVPEFNPEVASQNVALPFGIPPIHDEVRFFNSNGEELVELRATDQGDYNGVDLENFVFNVEIPDQYPVDIYTAKVRIYDEFGMEISFEKELVEIDLMNIDVYFTKNGARKNTFNAGESFDINVDYSDFYQEKSELGYRYSLTQDLTFLDPEKYTLTFENYVPYTQEETSIEPFNLISLKTPFSTSPNGLKGEYKLRVKIVDTILRKDNYGYASFFLE